MLTAAGPSWQTPPKPTETNGRIKHPHCPSTTPHPKRYFKDPDNLEAYLANSAFLAEINNERGDKDARYAQNLAALERLVLYRFEDDSTGGGARARLGRAADGV